MDQHENIKELYSENGLIFSEALNTTAAKKLYYITSVALLFSQHFWNVSGFGVFCLFVFLTKMGSVISKTGSDGNGIIL